MHVHTMYKQAVDGPARASKLASVPGLPFRVKVVEGLV